MRIDLIRHGYKNNDPAAHGTAVEALLQPGKIYRTVQFAAGVLGTLSSQTARIIIESTPVGRARATANLAYKVMSLDPRFQVSPPAVRDFLGSYVKCPGKGEEVLNLSSRAMIRLWEEGKRKAQRTGLSDEAETESLLAWCRQGFDNSYDAADPGISLREIACRVGHYMHETLARVQDDEYVLAFGHSGDLEPFLYLCLEMREGKSGLEQDAMAKRLAETKGALKPLTGISILPLEEGGDAMRGGNPQHRGGSRSEESRLILQAYPVGSGDSVGRWGAFEKNIFQEMSEWYQQHCRTFEVLEKKSAGAKRQG